jgi:acetyl esterase/lipase
VDSWHFHRSHPATVHQYGLEPDQKAELRIPSTGQHAFPVAVLIHGGYWHSRWELDLMDAMAVDLTNRGYATWNIEYRRPDDAGWDAMTKDVEQAVKHLAAISVDHPIDLERVVALGHSAGGQILLRLIADLNAQPNAPVHVAFGVSLAGVLDLETADRRWLGEAAVSTAIGAHHADLPAVYAASSPIRRLPLGSPHAVVYGLQDNLDLQDISRSYLAAARRNSDQVLELSGAGDHFDVIDPRSAIWPEIAALLNNAIHGLATFPSLGPVHAGGSASRKARG